MNYLAHLFLAGSSEEYIVGNMLGDFVKGKIDEGLPLGIQQGIQHHRQIDSFTDLHTMHCQSRNRIGKPYRRYAGVIVDLVYDHFLCQHWATFSDENFDGFITETYRLLDRYQHFFPDRLKSLFPYMVSENWLATYQSMQGIEIALNGISRRTKYSHVLHGAIVEVHKHYDNLEKDFLLFFPDLIVFADEARIRLSNI